MKYSAEKQNDGLKLSKGEPYNYLYFHRFEKRGGDGTRRLDMRKQGNTSAQGVIFITVIFFSNSMLLMVFY